MRKMYDAVTPANIPGDAQLVAGYLTGPYAWKPADWARFPNIPHVGIATQAIYSVGQVLDVETGDATPAQAPGWVQKRRAAGVDPTCYCNSSTWPSVRAAFQAAGVPEPHYWIAKYDQNPALPAGAVAKQHTNTAGWDLSSVADYWPGVDPAPEDNMTFNYSDPITVGPPFTTPPTVKQLGDVLNDIRNAGIGNAAAIAALKAEVDALQAATVAPVAVVDVAAIAKAVGDEIYRRLQG
jgi:hypothetical protein